jgi:bifunctional DNA-binding transcriptional regulator/antitoxin component of YhaV-PrlF toxin-antitoxin module
LIYHFHLSEGYSLKEALQGEVAMPRLVKGGKWAYGWVVIRPEGEMTIPPEARREYDFQAGDKVVFVPGSHRSGGFGLSTPRLMAALLERMKAEGRVLGQGQIGENGQLIVPPEVEVRPGDRLLAVRGSRYALGFVARGTIYEEALKHSDELEQFG